MINVHCHSNLDLYNEQWPTQLVCRPNVGDYIPSATKWRNGVQLELMVVRVTHRTAVSLPHNGPYLDVELHLPPHRFDNISHFEEWYRKIRLGY